MQPKYVVFKKWSGFQIGGQMPVAVPTLDRHIDRVFYLVSQLEAPRWGGVQNYDGVAMSAGPLHNIAVHRNGDQGDLFKLLRRIEVSDSTQAIEEVYEPLKDRGWYVGSDGYLRSSVTGQLVPGEDIVTEFSGPGGKTPQIGLRAKKAKEWVLAFHRLMSADATFEAQKSFAIDWILNTRALVETEAYQRWALLGNARDAAHVPMATLGPELDLALCVYHAHSVNAPTKAESTLKAALRRTESKEVAAKKLIRALGTAKFARWADTPDNKNRYDRTRQAVEKSKLWPVSVVRELMPQNF